jgi:hypothetical protein
LRRVRRIVLRVGRGLLVERQQPSRGWEKRRD